MKTLTGTVTSAKNAQTITVEVSKLWRHPVYKKRVTRSKKYQVHDEVGAKVGDQVLIESTRPLSKLKHFKVINVIKK